MDFGEEPIEGNRQGKSWCSCYGQFEVHSNKIVKFSLKYLNVVSDTGMKMTKQIRKRTIWSVSLVMTGLLPGKRKRERQTQLSLATTASPWSALFKCASVQMCKRLIKYIWENEKYWEKKRKNSWKSRNTYSTLLCTTHLSIHHNAIVYAECQEDTFCPQRAHLPRYSVSSILGTLNKQFKEKTIHCF